MEEDGDLWAVVRIRSGANVNKLYRMLATIGFCEISIFADLRQVNKAHFDAFTPVEEKARNEPSWASLPPATPPVQQPSPFHAERRTPLSTVSRKRGGGAELDQLPPAQPQPLASSPFATSSSPSTSRAQSLARVPQRADPLFLSEVKPEVQRGVVPEEVIELDDEEERLEEMEQSEQSAPPSDTPLSAEQIGELLQRRYHQSQADIGGPDIMMFQSASGKEEPRYKCHMCGEYITQVSYGRHATQHSDYKRFQCPIAGCSVSKTQKVHITVHMRSHHPDSPNILPLDLINDEMRDDFARLRKRCFPMMNVRVNHA